MAKIIVIPEWLSGQLSDDASVDKFVNDPSSIIESVVDVNNYYSAQLVFCMFLISEHKRDDNMLSIANKDIDAAYNALALHKISNTVNIELLKKQCLQKPIMWSEFVNSAKSSDDLQFKLQASRCGKFLLVFASTRFSTVSESCTEAIPANVIDAGLKALHEGFRINRSTTDTGSVFRENPALTELYLLKSFR